MIRLGSNTVPIVVEPYMIRLVSNTEHSVGPADMMRAELGPNSCWSQSTSSHSCYPGS